MQQHVQRGHLVKLGLLREQQRPAFEAGAISRRELLQVLRLALPAEDELLRIPVERQGRGAQRLLLVSALLRLAAVEHESLIAAFDEPEQALEPLRQTQMIERLQQVTEAGGQLFLATHASEMVRGFTLDDLVVMPNPATLVPLSQAPETAKRHYERSLDGAVVRGLFAPVPLLVEGPSDRPVLQTFWHALVQAGEVAPMTHLGVDVVNCEGVTLQPPMTELLNHAGKSVVVWAEQDVDAQKLARLQQSPWSVYLQHDTAPGRRNLEESLAQGDSMPALIAALRALAQDRGDDWLTQRDDLLSRRELDAAVRERAKAASDLEGFFGALDEADARSVIAAALAGKDTKTGAPPFAMKGARQGRLVAEAICENGGVPAVYRHLITALAAWISGPRNECATIAMADPAPAHTAETPAPGPALPAGGVEP